MEWVYLIIASLGEIGFVVFMKLSDGFKRHHYTALSVLSVSAGFYFLSKSMEVLPLGTAYTIWTGIGAIGSVVLGIVLFHEKKSFGKIFFVMMILAGVIGIRLSA